MALLLVTFSLHPSYTHLRFLELASLLAADREDAWFVGPASDSCSNQAIFHCASLAALAGPAWLRLYCKARRSATPDQTRPDATAWVYFAGGPAQARRIANVALLVRQVIEPWGVCSAAEADCLPAVMASSGAERKAASDELLERCLLHATKSAVERKSCHPEAYAAWVQRGDDGNTKRMAIGDLSLGAAHTGDARTRRREAIEDILDGDEAIDLKNPEVTYWAVSDELLFDRSRRLAGAALAAAVMADAKESTAEPSSAIAQIRSVVPTCVASLPSVFVGFAVMSKQTVASRRSKDEETSYFDRYRLDRRPVLGPTTMDNELGFIMANCCGCSVAPGVVMDPFCGTAGLLVAPAHFGCSIIGGERDVRVARGWRCTYVRKDQSACDNPSADTTAVPETADAAAAFSGSSVAERAAERKAAAEEKRRYLKVRPENPSSQEQGAVLSCSDTLAVLNERLEGCGRCGTCNSCAIEAKFAARDLCDPMLNFSHYSLPAPDVVLCDNRRPPWRDTDGATAGVVDYIITDPPYGLRAGARTGRGQDTSQRYAGDAIISDLLRTAASSLRRGGVLCYLLAVDLRPLVEDTKQDEDGGNEAASEKAVEKGTAALPQPLLANGSNIQQLWDRSERRNRRLAKCNGAEGGKQKEQRKEKRVKQKNGLVPQTRDIRVLLPSQFVVPSLPGELEVEDFAVQVLSGGMGRLLVVMKKL